MRRWCNIIFIICFIIFCCTVITISYTTDDTNLPDGTYPILIKPSTQEKFDCIIDWDLSPLEPHKIVLMEKVRNDLEELGEASDFYPLKNQIKVGTRHRSFL